MELTEWSPGIYFFSRLIVKEEFRNQGVATRLMKCMVRYLSTHPFKRVELGINPYGDLNYEHLKKFYMKYGFKPDPKEKNEMFLLTPADIPNEYKNC